ncbi:MAG: LapA family protein [Alphaproteobacteria bacterium]|nr:LapA family protein [Alphaproteobacteria bacterium]
MGRLIGWLVGIPFAAAAIVFAVSNRAPAVADLWPLPWAVEAPLYLFVLVAFAGGFLAGGLIAWLGSFSARRRDRAQARADVAAARRESEALRAGAARTESPQAVLPPPVV